MHIMIYSIGDETHECKRYLPGYCWNKVDVGKAQRMDNDTDVSICAPVSLCMMGCDT